MVVIDGVVPIGACIGWVRASPARCGGALHSGVAAKEPRFRLSIGVIALLREALHCLVASASLLLAAHSYSCPRVRG